MRSLLINKILLAVLESNLEAEQAYYLGLNRGRTAQTLKINNLKNQISKIKKEINDAIK